MLDEEARARIEALEMVAVMLLAAGMGARRLARMVQRQDLAAATREKVVPFPGGYAQSDLTVRHHRRLLRLARQAAEES